MTTFPFRTIPVPQSFERLVKALDRHCSSPVLLDIASVENAPPETCTSWLNRQEQRQQRRYTFAKRRREWLAGRICAKIAVKDYLLEKYRTHLNPADLVIDNSDSGRPFVRLAGSTPPIEMPEVSISHSGDMALALAAVSPCGVDIQKISPSLIRVKERFCRESEEILIQPLAKNQHPLMHLTLLWAAKEAAQKAWTGTDMPGFLDLVLIGIEPGYSEESVFLFNRLHHQSHPFSEVRVCVAELNQYGIGISIQQKGEPDA